MLFAYIDAALGSMLLQALVGTFLASVVMWRRAFAAPLIWLGLKRPTQDSDGEIHELSTDK
jgi:hypothetical protein